MTRQLEHHEISDRVDKYVDFKIIPVLCGIEKTQNIGMIMRSAEINGVEEVVIFDPPVEYAEQKLKKVSRNAEKFLRLKKINQLDDLLITYPKNEFSWVALEYTNTSKPIEIFKGFKNILLFVGNEKHGVPEYILKKTDVHVHLNMYGNISSYNVAVATSIAMYQLRLNFSS